MSKLARLGFLLTGLLACSAASAQVVINEIDYDQVGSDNMEYIELKNTGGSSVNLDTYSLQLVNGAGTAVYDTIDLPDVNLAPGAYYVVCANSTLTPNCNLDDAPNTDWVQNGAPDAVGLRDGATLVDAVSYEGNTGAPYTETAGTPAATGSDSNSIANIGLSRFPDGADTQNNSVDLTVRCSTPGNVNVSDSAACPTPGANPTVNIGTASVIEEDAGSIVLQVPVTLSSQPPVGFPVSVNYTTTVAGTATQNVDFTAIGGSLGFLNGGPLTQTINITTLGDTLDESDETIDVQLTSATNATLGTTQGTGTILDNDTATPSIDDVSDLEGDSGQTAFNFTLTLSVPADSSRSFHVYTADGSALAPGDYTAIPQAPLTIINFPAGVTTQPVTVQVNGDTAIEGDETFMVSVAEPPTAIGRGGPVLDTGLGEILNDDVPTVTIGNVSQAEGSPSGTTTFTFTATLSSVLPQQSCDFAIETLAPGTANDATPGVDYVAESNLAVSIPANTLSQTFSITVNQDTTVEADEVFDVSAFGEPFECDISNAEARGTIVNDDAAVPTLSIDDVSILEGTGAGTTTATFTVTLSAQPDVGSPVTVNFSGVSGTATLGTDFTLPAGTLTFTNGGSLTQTIAVAITRDNIDEPDEGYSVMLAGATNATIADATGAGTIQDDDGFPVPSIADISGNEGNAGFTQFDFTVTLSNPSSSTVQYQVFTQNGTAIAPGDYTAIAPQFITFYADQTSATVPVQVVGDTVPEADETFALAVAPAGGDIDGFNPIDTGTATIVNDDVVRELSIDDVSMSEGTGAGSSVAQFTVTLSAQPAVGMPVTVAYATANGTALSSDYTATSGTLTFTNGGALTQTIGVTLTRDNIDEGDETYFVNLSGAANATILDNQGLGTIVDDDGEPEPSVSEPTVTEGLSGTVNATFVITLSNPSDTAITYQVFTTDGTAVAASDFTAIPLSPPTFVTFPALATSQSVSVPVQGDNVVEANEAFDLNLAVAQPFDPARGVPTIIASGTATITNDDSATLTISPNGAPEGNAGLSARTFTVTLSNPVEGPVTVNYATADGTATVADNDYQAATGTITFASLQLTAQTGNINVVGDLEVEPNQVFTVNLSGLNAPAGVTIATGSADATIINDDSTALTITGASGNEGTGSNTVLTFTVSLSAPAKDPVSVQFTTVNGTAVAPGDFTATSGTVNFAGGQQSATIPVTVIGDNLVEPNESFTVTLSSPTGGATIGTGTATGTIVNDDQVSLTITDVTQPEGNGGGMTAFVFTITASGPSATPITVNYATGDISATAPADYQSVSGIATIAAQALTTTVTINVVADALFEPTETFRVTLSGATGATIADVEAIGTILGDDLPTAVPALDRGGLLLLMLLVALLGAVAVRRR